MFCNRWYDCDFCLKWVLYVIATDPGTITTIQGVGLPFREPGSFQNECAIVLPFQGHDKIILGPISILAYTLLMYNIRIYEANVVNPALPAFLHFHPARLQIKGGNEKSKRLSRARVYNWQEILIYTKHWWGTCLGHLDGIETKNGQNRTKCHPSPDRNGYF